MTSGSPADDEKHGDDFALVTKYFYFFSVERKGYSSLSIVVFLKYYYFVLYIFFVLLEAIDFLKRRESSVP